MSGFLSGLLDAALDASVVLSFDRNGYRRHARRFDPKDLDVDLAGRTALVTGANSGLGKAAARGLARLGARVVMLCRDEARGREARAELSRETGSRELEVVRLDVSDLGDVRRVAEGLGSGSVDVLVHNAGVLPDRRATTPDGLELTLATNLVGPFLLTGLLRPALERAAGRVVHVSSGGMYTQKLDVDGLFRGGADPFDGVVQYARTKRALVVLNELLAERLSGSGVTFSAMHPGWADTPAVRTSLPRFHASRRESSAAPRRGPTRSSGSPRARPPRAGAGSSGSTGEPAATTPVPGTRESREERGKLWAALVEAAGLDPATSPGKAREAGRAERGVLEVDAFRPEGAVHGAVVHDAVDEPGRVAELVGDLHAEAVQEDLLAEVVLFRRLEAGEGEDAPAAVEVREAEDVGERRDEEVAAEEEEVQPTRLGRGDRLEDAEGVVLRPRAVVAGRERPAEHDGLARHEGWRQAAEGAPHVAGRDVGGVEEPDLHGRSIPNFRILL